VNYFHRVTGSRSRILLWLAVPNLLFLIAFFGYRAEVENNAASRQDTCFGTITQCEHVGKGNENYCHYPFTVGDEQYTSVNVAEPEVGIGQNVAVYYDSQAPRNNALKALSEERRKNERIVYILLLALGAVVVIPCDRASNRATSGIGTGTIR
jgi:hypothetical protein